MSTSRWRILFWSAPLLLGSILFQASCSKAERRAEDRPVIRLAMDLWPGYFPLILAQERGTLREKGLLIEIDFPENTHGMVADFAGGKYHGICASLGDLILASQRSPEGRFVLCSNESVGADQLVGKPELRDPQSLRGARIATTLGGFSELFTRRFLLSRGLQPSDVTIVNSDAADIPRLLKSGQIEAGHAWEPYASRAKENGAIALFTTAETPGLVLDGLMLQRRWMTEQPEQARALVAAWFESVKWWRDHPEEAQNLIQNFLSRKGLPKEIISLDGIRLCDRDANLSLFQPESGQGLHAAATEYIEFFISRGTLPKRIRPDDVIDASLIK